MYTVREVMKMSKILVCDDDKEIVEAIDIYLSQEGYEVLKAYDGEEALKVLGREKIDLLVIDVMMPKLDGIRATLKIREANNMPIIIRSLAVLRIIKMKRSMKLEACRSTMT